MADAAHLNSPDVLLDIRRSLIAFHESSERVMLEAIADVDRTENWLRHERHPECKRRHLQCEQRYGEARIRYLAAKSRAPKMGRPMIEDEEKEFKRAKRMLEEAEHTLKMVEQALLELPRLVEQSANRVRMARRQMEDLVPVAVAQLDQMIEGVQNYLNQTGKSPGTSS